QHRQQQAERDRTLSRVDALLRAGPAAAPVILKELAVDRDEVLPRLRELWREHPDGKERMRAGLALLPSEPQPVGNELAGWMLQVEDPVEMLLFRDALAPHAAELVPSLWTRAGDTAAPAAERFRALVALAAFDVDGQLWKRYAATAVGQLVEPANA